MATTDILDSVLAIFQRMAEWFSTAIPTITDFFYTSEGLTFMGVLAVAGLAISVVFLLINGKDERFCSTFGSVG